MRPLLLDTPTVMGVESLGLDEVNVRVVARTLPGKQFEVGRDLRVRIVLAFREQGMQVTPPPAMAQYRAALRTALDAAGEAGRRHGRAWLAVLAPCGLAPGQRST